MSDAALCALAVRAGIAVDWIDANGAKQTVTPETQRTLLAAMGLASRNSREIADSIHRLERQAESAPTFLSVTTGGTVRLPRARHARLTLEDGESRTLAAQKTPDDALRLRVTAPPGYHRLQVDGRSLTLAVAPRRCWRLADAGGGRRLWGLTAQIYSLQRRGDGGIGDTTSVAMLARSAATLGADAVALSPSHALFGADLRRYGPYSPSSRLFLNPLYADPEIVFGTARVAAMRAPLRQGGTLINWPEAAAAKMALLRGLFAQFQQRDAGGKLAADFAAFCAESGDLLRQHALFEVLHAARLKSGDAQSSWRRWPQSWRAAASETVTRFAARNADEIAFHMFAQWLAARSFAAAQRAAIDAGMRIGLIADVAVGMDPGGSHAWSRPEDLLVGLSIGAPPDLFNPRGQNWGLTTFAPQALARGGFAPFLATLRAAMRHAGGVRIDHAMGLARLWLIPDGAGAGEGAYVTYPLDDMLRLIALESARHKAVVIAEDLGTVPPGFRERLERVGIAGMRVLWFERDGMAFRKPPQWDENAAALTTTHDLPTIAGWWRGRDIGLRARLKMLSAREAREARAARTRDRQALWRSLRAAGVVHGRMPKPTVAGPVVDGAIAFTAKTRSRLTLIPIEDALALVEQPNLPGTIDEHPNWRRRLALPADRVLQSADVQQRLSPLRRRRT